MFAGVCVCVCVCDGVKVWATVAQAGNVKGGRGKVEMLVLQIALMAWIVARRRQSQDVGSC